MSGPALSAPPRHRWRASLWLALAVALAAAGHARALDSALDYGRLFEQEVDRRLELPPEAQAEYAQALERALADAGLTALSAQFFLVVDRSPRVQAALLFWGPVEGTHHFIGASPCSTGLPGRYESFETPLGVFEHSVDNPDFRAEGTRNEQGIRGYGTSGMRVFDFGWVRAPRGWGDGRMGVMRLQVHATDPDLLEGRLGSACSRGCVRISATLNAFLDRHGLLDADYNEAAEAGRLLPVLRPDRKPAPWAGRYLVVVDSQGRERPAWSPAPGRPARRAAPAAAGVNR